MAVRPQTVALGALAVGAIMFASQSSARSSTVSQGKRSKLPTPVGPEADGGKRDKKKGKGAKLPTLGSGAPKGPPKRTRPPKRVVPGTPRPLDPDAPDPLATIIEGWTQRDNEIVMDNARFVWMQEGSPDIFTPGVIFDIAAKTARRTFPEGSWPVGGNDVPGSPGYPLYEEWMDLQGRHHGGAGRQIFERIAVLTKRELGFPIV